MLMNSFAFVIAALGLLESLANASPSSENVSQCLRNANVPFIEPSSSAYEDRLEFLTFNTRLPWFPEYVTKPTNQEQVSSALLCAKNAGVKVSARSGGHSYANYGLGGKNGSLVIDLVQFQSYSYDASTGIAEIGGGMKIGTFAQKLLSDGRALPHGTCAGVGIGGHATHGGYGYTSRAWGLMLDRITAVDVVLADGSYVHATNTSNPDIYFAVRGAAEFFGVVLKFQLETVPAPKTVFNFFYNFPSLTESASAAASALMHLQDFGRNKSAIDSKLSFGMFISKTTWSLRGQYMGPEAEFEPMKEEMLRGLPHFDPSPGVVGDRTWLESLIIMNDNVTIDAPKEEHDNFFAKSVVVPEESPITYEAAKYYFEYLIAEGQDLAQAGDWFSIINLYGGPGSAINAKPVDFSAYPDRSALWVLQHYSSFAASAAFPDSALEFVEGMNAAIEAKMPEADFTAYHNYIDPSLTAAEAHELYYGEALYAELQSLKKKLDPSNVFWNPQGITF